MVTKNGIQVHLKDLDGNVIETNSGKIVFAPGKEYHVFITIGERFQWYDATHLYVAITSRDDEAKKGWEADRQGEFAQVLCIRKDAPNRAHKITEMKRWIEASSYSGLAEDSGPTTHPFKMPPPFAEWKGPANDYEAVPDLQARPGCVQVSVKRGSLATSGPSKRKLRKSDPPVHTRGDIVLNKEPIRYIIPQWFKTLKGSQGEAMVFQFRNTSKAIGQGEKPKGAPSKTPKSNQQRAPTAIMQGPPASRASSPRAAKTNHDPAQTATEGSINDPEGDPDNITVADFRTPTRIPTRTRRYSPGRRHPVATETSVDEPEDDPDSLFVTDLRTPEHKVQDKVAEEASLRIKKSSSEEPAENKKRATVDDDLFWTGSRQVSGSKRGRTPPRTPGPSPTRLAGTTPSSNMSSQKKRRLELQLQLKEVRLERELLALDDED